MGTLYGGGISPLHGGEDFSVLSTTHLTKLGLSTSILLTLAEDTPVIPSHTTDIFVKTIL